MEIEVTGQNYQKFNCQLRCHITNDTNDNNDTDDTNGSYATNGTNETNDTNITNNASNTYNNNSTTTQNDWRHINRLPSCESKFSPNFECQNCLVRRTWRLWRCSN